VDIPYVDVVTSKAGATYYYYRFNRQGPRHRLPGKPGEAAFHRAYEKLHGATVAAEKARESGVPGERSMTALIKAYRASDEWLTKAPATKVDYEKALRPLEERFGHLDVATLPRPFVFELRQLYSSKPGKEPNDPVIRTPRRGNRMVAVLSILFTMSVNLGWRTDNPALRPGKSKTGPGWRSWTDEELETFLAAPTTSPQLRLAVMLAAATGQRGQDLVAMTWAKYDGTAIEVRQLKTNAEVWIPLHARARDVLLKTTRTADTILTRPDGDPWLIDHFRHEMTAAIKAAGLTGIVTHGLRATAGRWMAEAGCSEREIMSITGHSTVSSVTKYVREADSKIQAKSAMAKVELHRLERIKNRDSQKPN
jgi:integrase